MPAGPVSMRDTETGGKTAGWEDVGRIPAGDSEGKRDGGPLDRAPFAVGVITRLRIAGGQDLGFANQPSRKPLLCSALKTRQRCACCGARRGFSDGPRRFPAILLPVGAHSLDLLKASLLLRATAGRRLAADPVHAGRVRFAALFGVCRVPCRSRALSTLCAWCIH